MPREMGTVITCDGTGADGCPDKGRMMTGVIHFGNMRHWLKSQGWGRGLRKGYKRRDLCKSCLPIEVQLFKKAGSEYEAEKQRQLEERTAQRQARKEARAAAKLQQKQLRADERKAKKAARDAQPKKPRKKASTAVSVGAVTKAEEARIGRPPTSSPSAVSAPAPST
jgi:sRNA-binding protein